MSPNIPKTSQKRIVVIGGGFAGLKLINQLKHSNFQLVLIDKVNYHQFQPLLYQVATSGLEVSAIAFPFRKNFQQIKNFHFRLATAQCIIPEEHIVETTVGPITYDYLAIATGTDTNYYSMENVRVNALPMKSVSEALNVRNRILLNLEAALVCSNKTEQEALKNIVIVGGGATGVEIAGAIAEMKRYIFKKDYPDLDISHAKIYLLEASPKLLRNMSEQASIKSLLFLQRMGVTVLLDSAVADCSNGSVRLQDGKTIPTRTLIWVSGVSGKRLKGLPVTCYTHGERIIVDAFNRVTGYSDIFAIGDNCLLREAGYENGHPQVAQVAIQQGKLLAQNLQRLTQKQALLPFHYKDKGSMATVGRNKAVVDLHKFKSQGMFAWFIWMVVHLMSILGTKNKIQTLLNWIWSYTTYDQSLRLIIRNESKPDC